MHRLGASSCLERSDVVPPHLRCHFGPLARLDNPTEVPEPTCSNGLPGVQNDRFCCEAQCGACGGYNCKRRPGGEVRWGLWFTSLVFGRVVF